MLTCSTVKSPTVSLRRRPDKQNTPESIEDSPIWMQADHAVFDCDSMDERLLVIEKVGVGDPELVSNPVVKCQVERDSHIGQALVPPILLEIHSQCVVLRIEREKTQ